MIGVTHDGHVTALELRANRVAIDNSGTNLATRRFVVNAGTPAALAK